MLLTSTCSFYRRARKRIGGEFDEVRNNDNESLGADTDESRLKSLAQFAYDEPETPISERAGAADDASTALSCYEGGVGGDVRWSTDKRKGEIVEDGWKAGISNWRRHFFRSKKKIIVLVLFSKLLTC